MSNCYIMITRLLRQMIFLQVSSHAQFFIYVEVKSFYCKLTAANMTELNTLLFPLGWNLSGRSKYTGKRGDFISKSQ